MMHFLRYNTRHHLWFPRGYKGRWRPQLNPISSSSHGANDRRTFGFYEPLWAFRLRQRLFAFSGRQRCPNRAELSSAAFPSHSDADTWDIGPDGNRTCSYCGSIHSDDLMKICRLALEDERYAIEGTQKNYKVYVKQPGVRNASEGAIKFYMWHAPSTPSKEDQELFAKARDISRERFDKQLEAGGWVSRERRSAS